MKNRNLQLIFDSGIPEHLKVQDNEIYLHVIDTTWSRKDKLGLSTIISLPKKTFEQDNDQIKVVIMLHGHQSHKNAIYQPLLSDELCKLGYCVIRFDFRGQGDSTSNASSEEGRTIIQDIEDLETTIKLVDDDLFKSLVLNSNGKNALSMNIQNCSLKVEMLVAHSRGALVMFEYAIKHREIHIPLLVDCCGRFDGNGLIERYSRIHPNWREDNGFNLMTFRNGKYRKSWIPIPEIMSTANVDSSSFSKIDQSTEILLFYGSCDTVVPIKDGEEYHKLFGSRSSLLVIKGADHNFYGVENDTNFNNLPLRRGKVNYSVQFVRKLLEFLSKRNPQINS